MAYSSRIRHDVMGRGVVVELTASRAIVGTEKSDILVTSKDTFNDPAVDLTERLKKDDEVVYRACRIAQSNAATTARYVAASIARLCNCLQGQGKISSITPTFAFIDAVMRNRTVRIFFPQSAVYEPSLKGFFGTRNDDLVFKTVLRQGDTVTFIAMPTASARDRHPFGIEVSLAFNKDIENDWIIGIILTVRRNECDVWAKNFREWFTLTAYDHFDVLEDADVDLRLIMKQGTRIRFRASGVGSVSSIRQVEIIDVDQKQKLRPFQRNNDGQSTNRAVVNQNNTQRTSTSISHSPQSWVSKEYLNDVRSTRSGSSGHSLVHDGPRSDAFEETDMENVLEQELADMWDNEEDNVAGGGLSDERSSNNFSQDHQSSIGTFEVSSPMVEMTSVSATSQPTATDNPPDINLAGEASAIATGSTVASAKREIGCQSDRPKEVQILRELLQDEEIFELVTKRYGHMMFDVWQTMRW